MQISGAKGNNMYLEFEGGPVWPRRSVEDSAIKSEAKNGNSRCHLGSPTGVFLSNINMVNVKY